MHQTDAHSMHSVFPARRPEHALEDLLARAGVVAGGTGPADIAVHDERFFHRVLAGGSLALGEAYMDGWWDCGRLDEFFFSILRAGLDEAAQTWRMLPRVLHARAVNRSRRAKAFEIGERHYDIGNDLYERMLDRRMVYSCGYWKDAATLDQAQEGKLDLVCRKLRLRPGMHILDIGCGWGGLAAFAAEHYGAAVVGITVSRKQLELARRRTIGLPVEIRLQDYRDLRGRFDAVVSIGMFEHVGYKNHPGFFDAVYRCLDDEGLFLLHTIGSKQTSIVGDPWIEKYIFPNSLVPSMRQITGAFEKLFILEDWQNLGAHYDPTLMAWFHNFDSAWPELEEKYGPRFYRMWKYYLLSCAGAFRARWNNVWQMVFTKKGLTGGYEPVR